MASSCLANKLAAKRLSLITFFGARCVSHIAPAGHTALNTVPIVFLDKAELLPPGFMGGIPQGPREFFANAVNLEDRESGSDESQVELVINPPPRHQLPGQ